MKRVLEENQKTAKISVGKCRASSVYNGYYLSPVECKKDSSQDLEHVAGRPYDDEALERTKRE
jgi:hypothetical protein